MAAEDEIQIVRYQLKEAMVINDCLRHRMQFHLSSLNRDNGTKGICWSHSGNAYISVGMFGVSLTEFKPLDISFTSLNAYMGSTYRVCTGSFIAISYMAK